MRCQWLLLNRDFQKTSLREGQRWHLFLSPFTPFLGMEVMMPTTPKVILDQEAALGLEIIFLMKEPGTMLTPWVTILA